jgi:fucose permease
VQKSEQAISRQPRTGQLATLAQAGFFLIGIVNTLLGPILPMLSARWRLEDSQAGQLFIAQFVGAMTGSAVSGLLIRRLGLGPLLSCGFGIMSAGIAFLGFAPWVIGLASVFGCGLALGLSIPATNLLSSELNPGRRAAALNILNLIWALGAISGPPLISLLARDGDIAWPMFGLAGLLAALALAIRRCPAAAPTIKPEQASEKNSTTLQDWMSPYALLTGCLIFVYVGTETATGGWIASYARRLEMVGPSLWALAPSLFWAGLLTGRSLAPMILRRLSEMNLVLIGLIVAVAGLGIILAGNDLIIVSAGAGLAGLGMAPVFPTTFAIFTQHFGARAPQMAGVIFVLASLGGAVIPWMVGLTSSYFAYPGHAAHAGLRGGLAVPLAGGIVMIALQLAIISSLSRADSATT